jgi:hypothetical protein
MTPLDFMTETSFECTDNDSGDAAFVCVVRLIRGQDTVEEYLACVMFPLSANFSFAEIVDRDPSVEGGCATTRVSPWQI